MREHMLSVYVESDLEMPLIQINRTSEGIESNKSGEIFRLRTESNVRFRMNKKNNVIKESRMNY